MTFASQDVTLILVAFIGQLGVILAVVIPLLWSTRRHAAAANRAVNNVEPGELPLVKKVDLLDVKITDAVTRIANVEDAVAHVSEQATAAATLAADVKADLDGSHERADAVPATAEPGAAADAASQGSVCP